MNLSTKKKIDHTLGLPLLAGMNLMARCVGLLLGRNHDREPIRHVLVMKFQGMGSLVIAKPSLQELRKAYPNARILFWGTPSTAELAKLMPEFDEVLVLKDSGFAAGLITLFQCLIRIWNLKIDWAFDLEVYSKMSSILATLTCARNRAGFAVDSVRNRRYALTHLMFFNRYEYLGRAYRRLLGLAIDRIPAANDTVLLDWGGWKSPLARPAKLPPGNYVVVNIHAGELSLERRWPTPYFVELIQAITDAGLNVILIGHGKFEIEATAKVMDQIQSSRVFNLAGKLSLAETIACLNGADLVVSGDTAPMHLALATPVPVLALFGPTKASTYFPPQRERSLTLSHALYCSPCVHHWDPPPCSGDNQCMKLISVKEALGACETLLGKTLRARNTSQSLERSDYFAGLVYERN